MKASEDVCMMEIAFSERSLVQASGFEGNLQLSEGRLAPSMFELSDY